MPEEQEDLGLAPPVPPLLRLLLLALLLLTPAGSTETTESV